MGGQYDFNLSKMLASGISSQSQYTSHSVFFGHAVTIERRRPGNKLLGHDAEDGLNTDEVDDKRRDGSNDEKRTPDLDRTSLHCFTKTAPNLVAQMQQILLEPATSNLYVNRITSESEDFEAHEGNRLERLSKRAKTLEEKAEYALGREVLKVRPP